MNLELDLENIKSNDRLPFVNYIIKQIQKEVLNQFDERKILKLENYINSNNTIDFVLRDKHIKVRDLYLIAVYNLVIEELDENIFNIIVNRNINIPDSNSLLISLLKLLEYGNLSVNKYGLLTNIMQDIADNIDTYFKKYKLGVE